MGLVWNLLMAEAMSGLTSITGTNTVACLLACVLDGESSYVTFLSGTHHLFI